MKISLCMIVKNEEKYIKMCLENAFKLADEAIIVDTGSTDKTIDIIKKFGDKVKIITYKWNNDFAEARNISLEKATGDWILMLDADEKLLCNNVAVREILEDSQVEGYEIPLYNIIDSKSVLYSAVYCKLFRNKGYRYKGEIHEQLNIENSGVNVVNIDSTICKVIHYGYLGSNMKKKDKANRNLEILLEQENKDPDNPYVHYNLGASYSVKHEYKKALDHFFKCNELLTKSSKVEITKYEVDMVKRIAECYYCLHENELCIDFINDMVKDSVFNGFVDLYYMLGNCYFNIKNYDESENAFKKCIEIGETKEYISIKGMGSFWPKLALARLNVVRNNIVEAINMYMECVFDPNNIVGEGIDEFRTFLTKNNLTEILNGFNKIIDKNKINN